MSADKMFEELGYVKVKTELTEVYKHKKYYKELYFSNLTKALTFAGDYTFANLDELRAINKKCEELGWI